LLDSPAQHAIIRGLQTGDREAWTQLYDSYSLDVWRYAARCLGADAPAVADVVQETFLEAAGAARGFNPQRGTLWQWLTGIAHHKVTAYWRQASRTARLQKLAESQAFDVNRWLCDGQPATQPIEQRELADLVRGTLAELTSEYAALLTAKYLDEQSLSEMAAQWNSTVEAIKSKLARARTEFRAKFERLYPRPTADLRNNNAGPNENQRDAVKQSKIEPNRDVP
jgi:RNA polymerase sigma-70 factor, ECF subfamily